MKNRSDLKRIFAAITAAALICGLLSACGNEQKRTSYLVYYTNNLSDDILYREYVMNSELTKDCYAKVAELLDQMFAADYTEESYYSVKPDDLDYQFTYDPSGLLTVDFSPEYYEMTNVKEIILRSAVVLTVIQVDGISEVSFLVNGEMLKNANGYPVGVMNADDFVSILLNEAGMLKKEATVRLYFADSEGSSLDTVSVTHEVTGNNTSEEEYIIKMLIAGPPEGSGLLRTISSEVELVKAVTTDGICYVNFSSNFLEQKQPVSDELMVYSIVNSLCRLRKVSAVQFQVEGDANVVLHFDLDLSEPVYPNYDY